jgi:hypothetical protein
MRSNARRRISPRSRGDVAAQSALHRGVGDGRDGLACRRVLDVEPVTGGRGPPGPADVEVGRHCVEDAAFAVSGACHEGLRVDDVDDSEDSED